MGNLAADARWAVEQLCIVAERLARALEEGQGQPEILWAYPVGTAEYPPEHWYAACIHDMTGKANNGYPHTGVDLNLDKRPWGDIDRGLPVLTVAPGVVRAVSYSTSYLGSVIVESQYNGRPLFWRYWHLADDAVFRSLSVGQMVAAGQWIGAIGNYTLGEGGDHAHIDCALDLFGAHWWFTNHPEIRWTDPVAIWLANLDPVRVQAMLRKG